MKIKIDVNKEKKPIGDLFGIFFEDLNHAADGGLYGELVQNRSFEFSEIDNPSYNNLTAWEKIENNGAVKLLIETGNPISEKNPHYLAMDIEAGSDVGVQNLGWGSGISLLENARYRFVCYAKREQCMEDAVTVSLRSKEGKVYTAQRIYLTSSWRKYELEFTSPVTDSGARLGLTTNGRGKVYIDFVSLFPEDTYKKRPNGLRKDIAKLLEDMQPKFLRFPGGCLVHDGSLDMDVRDSMYRWKNTLGAVETRPARRNNWRYNQTLGLGFYELFLFCEDIGAKPIPVVSGGYDPHHKRAVPISEIQPWVDDALDLIEFANGGADTKWGAVRAEMGHAAPFHMEYLAIGNEEVGEDFFERFDIIYKAVRHKYPNIKVIGTSGPNAAGGAFERGWKSAIENDVDFVDEHYYQAPEWFLANHHRYDSYSEKGPKVFLGEYASWGNTWYNALVEASFMIGLERNAHAVGLACYAPMLAHFDYVNWKPDMIWFDNEQAFGTANYHVQKLFMNHLGKYQLTVETEEKPENYVLSGDKPITGNVFLSNYESEVRYSEISLTDEDTNEIYTFNDCRFNIEDGSRFLLTDVSASNYSLRLKAKETKGFQGFKILFGSRDDSNEFCWTLGGWQNQDTFIGEKTNSANSDLSQSLLAIEKDRVYDLRLEVRNRCIRAFVDEVMYHDIESKPVIVEPLYVSVQETEAGRSISEPLQDSDIELLAHASGAGRSLRELLAHASGAGRSLRELLAHASGEGGIVIKAVNVSEKACETEIAISNTELPDELEAEVYFMEGWHPDACNSLNTPDIVKHSELKMRLNPSGFRFTFPGMSIYVIKLSKTQTVNLGEKSEV